MARLAVHHQSLDQVQIAELASVLHELMPIAEEGEQPTSVVGRHNGRGQWQRIKAVYANGWEVVVNFRRDGSVSSTSARVRMVTGG